MRSYVAITGTIFAVLAVLHFWRIVVEWDRVASNLGYFGSVAAIGVLSGALAAWAWRLVAKTLPRGKRG